jgi:hypothetical protein
MGLTVPDAFPRTRRPLPWALAAFVVMLFLIPIDSTSLRLHLPVDSHPDRLALLILLVLWLWFGGDQRALLRTPRSKLWVTAVAVFVVLAVASLLLDAGRIINLGEFTLAEKRFALLGSFVAIGWFALTALRYEDLRGFTSLLIGLGALMALGMVVERKTGYNVFYNWSAVLLKPIATVAASPTGIHPGLGSDGRMIVVGPTEHGLAAATMFVVVLPFALVRMFDADSRMVWWRNGAAFVLMLSGAMATDRKTALLVPIAVVFYVAWYRPREILRLAPIGLVVLVAAVHVAAPGALGTVLDINQAATSNSTTHRLGDLSGTTPDLEAHLLLGRGFGTVNTDQSGEFRINDNQYLDDAREVGVLGLLAYAWLILAPIAAARSAIRSRDPGRSSLALASAAGCVAFLVANALFDTLSFPQAPYMFFVVAAVSTVAVAGSQGNVEPALGVRRLLRRPSALRVAADGALP